MANLYRSSKSLRPAPPRNRFPSCCTVHFADLEMAKPFYQTHFAHLSICPPYKCATPISSCLNRSGHSRFLMSTFPDKHSAQRCHPLESMRPRAGSIPAQWVRRIWTSFLILDHFNCNNKAFAPPFFSPAAPHFSPSSLLVVST